MIDAGDLRKGITLEIDGVLYQVLDFQHIKMGRGSAQVRMKLKDIRAGHIIERAVQAGTDDFLSKPVNKTELLKRVENMLKLYHVSDEVERLRQYIEKMEVRT